MVRSLASSRATPMLSLAVALSNAYFLNAQTSPAAAAKAQALYNAGAVAYARNDLATALSDFEAVVHLLPANESGHSSLGVVLLKLGRTKESVPELERALKLNPSDTVAQTNLASAYSQLAQPERALPLFAKLDASAQSHGHHLPADASVS